MKNIYSNIFKLNKKNILKATHYLNSNDIVALPTETVYGLAGNAYSNKSIKKIYSLKKRPKFNPLIIHYYELKNIYKDVEVNDSFLAQSDSCARILTDAGLVLTQKESGFAHNDPGCHNQIWCRKHAD